MSDAVDVCVLSEAPAKVLGIDVHEVGVFLFLSFFAGASAFIILSCFRFRCCLRINFLCPFPHQQLEPILPTPLFRSVRESLFSNFRAGGELDELLEQHARGVALFIVEFELFRLRWC